MINKMTASAERISKVWTRADAQLLVDLGFPGANRLELVEGNLIDHMGKNRLHVFWQLLIRDWLINVFGSERVQTESPVEVAINDRETSEPEPDVMVTRLSIRDYSATPLASDILLVVEIADSTLKFDLSVKADLYARAGIEEYWVLDVNERRLWVHRVAHNGSFGHPFGLRSNEEVGPLADPFSLLCLDRLLK